MIIWFHPYLLKLFQFQWLFEAVRAGDRLAETGRAGADGMKIPWFSLEMIIMISSLYDPFIIIISSMKQENMQS